MQDQDANKDSEKKSRKSKVRFYGCVDAVIVIMLENDRYLHAKRNIELTETVAEQLLCSKRTAQRYIAEARKEVNRIGKEKKEKALARALRDRELLFRRALKKQEDKQALEVVKDRDKLQNLYVDQVKQSGEVTVKNIDMNMFTDFGLERLRRGDKVEDVLLDIKSIKQNANTDTNSR
jgi:hypothetical protein